jgi:hypothetical protein
MGLLELPRQAVESALSIVGVRVGTEEPQFSATRLTDRVQIRRYGTRIAAETVVTGDEEGARSVGFRRLAGYIFGGNQRDESIAMTAPVVQSSAAGRSIIRFFMPSTWSLASLPAPHDDTVRLVEVPAETFAVLRFSGDRSSEAVAAHSRELLETLQVNDIHPAGPAVAWFYDPPWTLPFRRRNEVAVPIVRGPSTRGRS